MPFDDEHEAKVEATRPGALHRLRAFFETHPGMYLLGGLLSIFATVITIATLYQIMSDLRDRREERIQRAWEHLMTRTGGKTGKGAAINNLIELSQDVAGIDLSCQSVGRWEGSECKMPAIFEGFRLPKNHEELYADTPWRDIVGTRAEDGPRPNPKEINFSYSVISKSELRGYSFAPDSFEGTYIDNSNLSSSIFFEVIPDIYIVWSDLSKATINDYIISRSDFSNLSGTQIRSRYLMDALYKIPGIGEQFERGYEDIVGQGNWFWADRPPKFVSPIFKGIRATVAWPLVKSKSVRICDPRFRGSGFAGEFERFVNMILVPRIKLGEVEPFLLADKTVDGSDFFISQGVTYRLQGQIRQGKGICPAIALSDAIALFPSAYPAPVYASDDDFRVTLRYRPKAED